MTGKRLLDTLNRSWPGRLIVCAGLLLIMLYCNFKTNLVADDYLYCFSFLDGTRIDSVLDIIPSMTAHSLSMNGRLAAHALVQLFLMLPLPIFRGLNALMFLALILLMYRISRGEGRHNALLLAVLFGGLWCLQLDFGQVFLWLDGAVNYLWCAVLVLLFLLPYVRMFMSGRSLRPWQGLLFTVFSFVVGGYSENSTVAAVFMALLFVVLTRLLNGGRLRLWCLLSLGAAVLGFILLMTSPAELANKSTEFSLPVLWANLLETGRIWLLYWPALLSFALLYAGACAARLPLKLRLLALVFFGGSLAGHFVLSFAMYCAFRSTYITIILLLTACGILYAPLFEGRGRPAILALSAVCLAFTLFLGYKGIGDIVRTGYEISSNEQCVRDCVARGETNVYLPFVYPSTKYPACIGLSYLTDDPGHWANQSMAKYYGVETISAY